jgi:SAM-dependent methyltransferase
VSRDAAGFYDALAVSYHLVYDDWEASVERQGAQLDAVLREELGSAADDPAPGTVLDAACGIGTQALGLAARGWRVAGSDLSPAAVARARAEAARRGLDVELSVADLREVHDHHRRGFDAVLACDNSLPHLLTDDDLRAALVQMRRATAPGGVCVVSVRDYGALLAAGELAAPSLQPYGSRRHGGREYSLFQEWVPRPQPDGRLLYDLTMYLLEADPGRSNPADPAAKALPHEPLTTTYYAVSTGRLLELMHDAGFDHPRRVNGRFFQPLLVGRVEAG